MPPPSCAAAKPRACVVAVSLCGLLLVLQPVGVAALGRSVEDCQRVALMFDNTCPNSVTDPGTGAVSYADPGADEFAVRSSTWALACAHATMTQRSLLF